MKTFQPGDRVLVDINSGIGGDERNWRLATVTSPTDRQYGWTAARTDCGLERGPGWTPDEIRLA